MKFLSIFSRANKASLGGLLFLLFTTHAPSVFADGHSPHSFSANVTLTSDYVYRGISQTNENPALQGGLDYSYDSSYPFDFYLGVWASNVEFNGGGDNAASLEIDVYGGMKGELANGLGWDLGIMYYAYPDQNEDGGIDYDFYEFYGSLSYSWDIATADIGVAYTTDFFGEDNEAIWWHGGLGLDMGMVNPYIQLGYQDVEGDRTTGDELGFDYTYYAVGVSTSVDILTFDLSWQEAYGDCNPLVDGDLCDSLVFSVSSSF